MKNEKEFLEWKKTHPGYHRIGSKGEHYYHPKTGEHFYNGVAWSKKLWESFINEMS